MKKNNGVGDLFWMEFRKWVQTKIKCGEINVFTNKRLFLIFKKEYLPNYVKKHDGNGIYRAYMNLITYEDVSTTLYKKVVLQLLRDGYIERVGRKKFRVVRAAQNEKIHVKAGGFDTKTAIREVDGGDGA